MSLQQAEQALDSAEWDRDRALELVNKAEGELDRAEAILRIGREESRSGAERPRCYRG